MSATTVNAMLSTPTLIEGDAVKPVSRSAATDPVYVIDEVLPGTHSGHDVRKYRIRRDRDGKKSGRWYRRSELVVAGLTVEVNGKVIAGREQWR